MTVSTFYSLPPTSIDAETPADGYPNAINIGVVLLGGGKAALRRALVAFDVFGAAAEGRPLRADDSFTAADLLFEITSIVGTPGFACRVERVTRADWDYLTANWNNYNSAGAWTTAGGDAGTPPAALGYNAPSAIGPFVIAGALDFVTDAIANRGGLVNLRHMAINENPPATAEYAPIGGTTDSLRARLRVTYTPRVPTPVAEWKGSTGAEQAAGGAPPARATSAAVAAPPAKAARTGRATDGG